MLVFIRRASISLACLAGCGMGQDNPSAAIAPLLRDGDAAFLKGDYETARRSFDKALELGRETPEDNPLRYDTLKRLTSVRAAAGEFADAGAYLEQAIAWRENVLGKNDPKIADDLLVSVGLSRGMKDYDRAFLILRRVMSMHVAASTFDSTPVADDFSRMAQISLEEKKPESAVGSLNAALRIRTKLANPLHFSLVNDLDRLGEVYIALRDYPNAEEAYRHVLVIRETLYGKEHADLISTIDGLAYACFGQKKYDVAEPIYRRLLSLWETSVGKDHPMVAVALDKIAVFYAEQKKYDQTRDALERSSAIRAHFHATGLAQQATQAFTEAHADQARTYYQRALADLDPPNPINDELRAQIEDIIKSLESIEKKPASRTPARSRK